MIQRLSFRMRLLAGAILWIVAGMTVSWLALTALVREHVLEEAMEELEHHVAELAELGVLGPDGRPALLHSLSDRRFAIAGSGYYWQIARPGGADMASPSLVGFRIPLTGGTDGDPLQIVPGPAGDMMLVQRSIGSADQLLKLAVGIDRSQLEISFARFRNTLAFVQGAIAAGLILAVVAQISFGLRPLLRLRDALAAIRRGEADALPDDLPGEVAPLVDNMNALLRANHDVVQRARLQAGNLAHALKGPLAILMDEGASLSAAGLPGETVTAQSERMRRQIDYQLAHARVAGASGAPSSVVRVAPALQAVISAVSRLYRDRTLKFTTTGADAAAIAACEVEDFEEMLGNLVENAAKWAATLVRVAVTSTSDKMVRITIEDDGPGMPAAERERVFLAGQRLDEAVAGHGLGLAIVRDIATLYGGNVHIGDSELGGASVVLDLPQPR